jgi:hypothetical protein
MEQTDPMEQEYHLILQKEVEQQLEMEGLIKKHAWTSPKDDILIFYLDLAC